MPVFELSPKYQKAIYNKYTIIDHIHLLDVDHNFGILETQLAKTKKDYYHPTDRYIIEHFDTDYYLPDFPYGLSLYNLFTVFKRLDIPLFTMLLATNSFGIEQEVVALSPDPTDQPTVVCTFVNHAEHYRDVTISADEITVPGLCMMAGVRRVHRNAMYRFLERESLLDLIAVSK